MSRLSERIENFNNAFELYKEMCSGYISDKKNNAYRLGLAQSFEIVSELGWKVLKDYLFQEGIDVRTPKETIKEAFQKEVIKNGQAWIDIIDARNLTSHEYNTDKVNILLESISSIYYQELSEFKNWLGTIDGK